MFANGNSCLFVNKPTTNNAMVDNSLKLPQFSFKLSWDVEKGTIICSQNKVVKKHLDVTSFIHPIVMNYFVKKYSSMTEEKQQKTSFVFYLNATKEDITIRSTPKYRDDRPFYDWCMIKWVNSDGTFENVPGKVLAIFQEFKSVENGDDEVSKPAILLHSCHGMGQKENCLSTKQKTEQLKTNAISECWQLECN